MCGLRLTRRLPKALPVADVLRLLNTPTGDDARSLRDRALLELLYSTGARISEATGLDVDDVDRAERTVVLDGKGGRQRLVPVGRPALEALDAYLVRARPALAAKGRGTGAVFLNARGRLSGGAWQVLKVAAERAGISRRYPHAAALVRHASSGRRGGRAGGSCWDTSVTTQVYTLVTVNTLREVWTTHPRALG